MAPKPVISPYMPHHRIQLTSYLKDWTEVEVWTAPPIHEYRKPERIARLTGVALICHAHDLMDIIKADVDIKTLKPTTEQSTQDVDVSENAGIRAALVCEVLMTRRVNKADCWRRCVSGIREMTDLETAHWLGMALLRYKKSSVMKALRIMLTDQ